MAARTYSTWTIYRRVAQHARPYWRHISLILALNFLAVPLRLLVPLPLKLAVDNVLQDKPLSGAPHGLAHLLPHGSDGYGLLALAAGLLVAITALAYANALGIWLLSSYTGQRLVTRFRSQLFRHAQGLSLSYHENLGTSESTYRIQYDAPAIQWIAIEGVIPFITAAVMVVAMVCVTAALDPGLALVAVAVIPPLFVLTRSWGRRLRKQWRDVKQLQSSAMSVVQETLGGLRVVKAFGTEDRQHDRFEDLAERGVAGQIRVAMSQGTFELLSGIVLAVGSAAALYLGVRHVQSGQLTLGDFLIVWAYLAQLHAPLQTISNKLTTLQDSMASAERALALLDETPAVSEKPNAVPIARCRGAVRFDRVCFAYRAEMQVIHDVSFDVPAGSHVGIVGPTGAGKTTLINLLIRFYDPSAGTVLLDGVDLSDYRLDDLRDQFAIVLQEPLLFSTSIAENIAYARPGATVSDIVGAAKAANAHSFIERLRDGYNTSVGERGLQLSGGERQRIALARAFLKDAPILILDEPTSSVDVASESSIIEALGRLMAGRTTFVIAHRPTILQACDTYVHLEDGHVVAVDHELAAVSS
jgi:ATP-binding cassette, subfamily B, bacterial